MTVEAKVDKEHTLTFRLSSTKLDVTELLREVALHAALHVISEFTHITILSIT